VIESAPTRQDLVLEFINEHVTNHASDGHTWNLPFLHIPFLDWLRYDWVMLCVAVVVSVVVATIGARRHRPVPTGLSNVIEALVVFIRDDIAIANLGAKEGRRLTPFFCSLFVFILSVNLLGLIPMCSSATGNINVTCALALLFLVLAVGLAISRRGVLGFLKSFVPHGAPVILLPILVPIEVISLLARAFALMVRLFANMLAGHIIIFAMLGLVVIFGYLTFPVVGIVVALLFAFELFVAIFQTYIFTLLSAIFIGLLLNPEH